MLLFFSGWMIMKLTWKTFLKVLDEYQKTFGESWRSAQTDSTQPWPYLTEALTKFQVCFFFLLQF